MKVAGALTLFTSVISAGAFCPQTSHPFLSRQLTVLHENVLEGRKIQGDVKPINNFILLKVAEAIDKTDGGILLTGKAKVKKSEGKVIAVGPGKIHPDSGVVFDMPVAEGESVVYGKYDGTEIDYNGAKHTLIRDDDVLVKFKGEKLALANAEVVRDCVLVRVEEEEASEGGILIAKTSKSENRPSTGEVVKVGPGRIAANGELMAMDVAVGDFIKFRDFAGNEVEIDGKEFSVVRMADILAKF
jgi:chaperonin GroES